MRPHACIIFQSRPSTCEDTAQVRWYSPWPCAIDCLVHWSSPVRKLVFSQQDGPVRRSSPTRKLMATTVEPVSLGYSIYGLPCVGEAGSFQTKRI